MTKKERMLIYFSFYPNHLEMAQRWESNTTEQKIADDMNLSVDYVQYVRKELVKLLEINTGGWEKICYELVLMELIKEGSRIKYSLKEIPCPYLIEKTEELQGREQGKQIQKKDSAWKKKQKKSKSRLKDD
jgi:hypothetical protein